MLFFYCIFELLSVTWPMTEPTQACKQKLHKLRGRLVNRHFWHPVVSACHHSTRLQIAGIEHQCRLKFTVTSFGNLRFTRRDYVLVDICVLSPWTCWELIKTFCLFCLFCCVIVGILFAHVLKIVWPLTCSRSIRPVRACSQVRFRAYRPVLTTLVSCSSSGTMAAVRQPCRNIRSCNTGLNVFTCTEVTRLRSTFSTKDKPNFPQ